MAKKFLDLVGLDTLWKKIKTVFATNNDLTKATSDIYDLQQADINMNSQLTAIGDEVTRIGEDMVSSSSVGKANGVASLGSDGKVPSAQLPSYVDDVVEYSDRSKFPTTGEGGKIYIANDTNKTYRWGGTAYVEISSSLALGETASTAYAGNKGKANADAIVDLRNNKANKSEFDTLNETFKREQGRITVNDSRSANNEKNIQALQPRVTALENNKADKSSLSNYVTKTDLGTYATKSGIDNGINTKVSDAVDPNNLVNKFDTTVGDVAVSVSDGELLELNITSISKSELDQILV